MESVVIKIDPNNGNVMEVYYMTPLIEHEINQGVLTNLKIMTGDVLNGIVYIPERKTFILTGKEWGFYYEVIFDNQ